MLQRIWSPLSVSSPAWLHLQQHYQWVPSVPCSKCKIELLESCPILIAATLISWRHIQCVTIRNHIMGSVCPVMPTDATAHQSASSVTALKGVMHVLLMSELHDWWWMKYIVVLGCTVNNWRVLAYLYYLNISENPLSQLILLTNYSEMTWSLISAVINMARSQGANTLI